MPSTKTNYITVYLGDSQVYASATKETALASPPPNGAKLEDKRVIFIAFEPDTQDLVVYPLPLEEVLNAEIVEPKSKKAKENVEES